MSCCLKRLRRVPRRQRLSGAGRNAFRRSMPNSKLLTANARCQRTRSSVEASFEGSLPSDSPKNLKIHIGGLYPPSAIQKAKTPTVVIHCSSSDFFAIHEVLVLGHASQPQLTRKSKRRARGDRKESRRTTGIAQMNELSPDPDKERNPSEWVNSKL